MLNNSELIYRKASLVITAILLSVACLPSWADTHTAGRFRSDILASMAGAMKMNTQISSLPDGIHVATLSYAGKPVTVTVDNGEVSHIGYSIFDADLRAAAPSPFYDVVERYALLESLPLERIKTVERELFEEGVHFSTGNLKMLPSLYGNKSIEFSLSNENGKKYVASWVKGGSPVCSVSLPYTYEFLHGTTMEENERRLIDDLTRMSASEFNNFAFEQPEVESMVTFFPSNYYILPGESYYFDNFNGNRYYTRSDSVTYKPIFDNTYPRETLANVCTALETPHNLRLNLKLVQYGYKTSTVNLPLAALVDYFDRTGCTPFFGIIEHDDNKTVCELLARNIDEGYCHILKITVPTEDIGLSDATFTARMNSYIPISKLTSLFDEVNK